MMISRSKPAGAASAAAPVKEKKKKKLPKLLDFVAIRDYTGAITLLEFQRSAGQASEDSDLWIAYCAFHLGNYQKAADEYRALADKASTHPDVWSGLACACFFLGMYKEASEAAGSAPASRLKNRLNFHCAHKFTDEQMLMTYHQQLQDLVEDQLSLAAIHYLRSHYQEAIDIYKRVLLDNREFLALNVYVALCYYKLDYYDVSQEVLAVYLAHYPDRYLRL
jgi:intraflagellar transport protein 56